MCVATQGVVARFFLSLLTRFLRRLSRRDSRVLPRVQGVLRFLAKYSQYDRDPVSI